MVMRWTVMDCGAGCNNSPWLLVMRPHPDHLYGPLAFQHLIDRAMLDINPAGAKPSEVPGKFLKRRGLLKGVVYQSRTFLHLDNGVFIPSMSDSRIPGTVSR